MLEIDVDLSDEQWQVLDDTIEDWMAETKQIDDILIIGIKF